MNKLVHVRLDPFLPKKGYTNILKSEINVFSQNEWKVFYFLTVNYISCFSKSLETVDEKKKRS